MENIGIQAVLDDRNFQQGLSRFQKGLGTMESGASKTANVLSSLGNVAQGALVVGIGAASAAIAGFVAISKIGLDTTLAWGATLDKLGDEFGMTGDVAAKWAAAFSKVGLSVEEGSMGLNFFTRGMAETFKVNEKGVKTLTPFGEALQKLGVNAYDAKGKLKTMDQVMPSIMDKFKKMKPGIERTRLAMELFGARGGSKFIDFLAQGTEGLAKADQLVKEFGLSLTDAQVNAIEDFGFATSELNLKIKGLWTQVGLQVLPVVRRFIDFVSNNVLPVLNRFVQDNLPKLVAGFDKFVSFMQANVLPLLDRFKKAFDKGGIGGIIDQLGVELGNAFKGFDAAKMLGTIGGNLATLWSTKIQPELAKWGGQFWQWLVGKDGKGGALSEIGTQFGKIATEIQNWAKKNAPDWIKTFDAWKTSFWNWLTDSKEGVIANLSVKLVAVTEALKLWAGGPEAQKKFIEVGETIATTIIDGITQLFRDNPDGESVFVTLGVSLGRAANNVLETFRKIGDSIAQGIIQGIAMKFGFDQAGAQDVARKTVAWLNRYVDFIIQWGTPTALAQRLFDNFVMSWNNLFRLWQPGTTPAPSGTPGGSIGGTSGGSIGAASAPRASVSQPVTTNTNTTSRSVSVSFAPGSLSFSGAASGEIENIAQTIANRTVAAILSAA